MEVVAALVDFPREGRLELVGGKIAQPRRLKPVPARRVPAQPDLAQPNFARPRTDRRMPLQPRPLQPKSLRSMSTRPMVARPGLARPTGARAEIYRRRRLAVAAILLIGLALLIMVTNLAVQAALGRTGGGPLTATGALPGGRLAGSEVYVVRPGDTIWSIAQSIEPNRDVRPLVDKITAHLNGTRLYPGERLTLPLSR